MRVVRLSGVALMLALLVGTAVPVAAQAPTSGQFKFISGSPYSPQPTITVPGSGTFYTSIYQGQFLSGAPTTGYVDIYCVDFFHEVHNGQTWDAWFTPLSSTDFSHTYGVAVRGWDSDIAHQRYNAAAWLATQFPISAATKATSWPMYQAAIWSLMGQTTNSFAVDPASTTSAFTLSIFADGFRTSAEGALNDAVAGGNTDAFKAQASDWTIISQTGAGTVDPASLTQEFMTHTSVVPEPATVVLLLTGLLAIGGVAYVRGFSA
jgi:hypothetical protein